SITQGDTPYDFILEFDGTGDIVDFDWDVEGISYTGDSINVTFPDTGTYDVELVVTDACGDQDSISKVITIQLDSRADLVDAGLSIYPNPATDVVTLRLETTLDHSTFELYNLNGQLIQRQTLSPNTPEQTIRLEDVSEGVYMVRILEKGTAVSQRKLIIR
ncbi:MAG: T9SS type A sorting domain-containing protein, partial [Bacteroidota bacterium]